MSHERWMHRALEIAKRGLGRVRTNPPVGCVIELNGKIIAEGYHEYFGGPHAEVNAVNAIPPALQSEIPHATVYVTLEPCSFEGKTPACAPMLAQKGFRKVVIGCKDPHPRVNGKGVEILQKHGLRVQTGLLEAACSRLIHPFRTGLLHQRPYVHLKWAQSRDRKIGKKDTPVRISHPYTQFITHQIRAQADAILVGTGTLLTDQPRLDNRWHPGPSPALVVIDRSDAIQDPSAPYFRDRLKIGYLPSHSKQGHLYDHLIEIPPNSSDEEQWNHLLQALYSLDIGYLMVEGGAQLLQSIIDTSTFDRATIFRDPQMVGKGIKAPQLKGRLLRSYPMGTSEVMELEPPFQ